jgi:anthranilate synthase/aminodeoxychorismate synthase-like glutamine amidotransferase
MSTRVRLLLIDNYDSFTFNLAQAFMVLGASVEVRRNDAITVQQALELAPTHLCISPGPGRPEDAGVSMAALEAFHGKVPILGVCLGHQALAMHFGATVCRADPIHGKASVISHDGRTLFRGLPASLQVGRYHSLVASRDTLPASLQVSAQTDDGLVMGLRHSEHPTEGVQFHPESILTPDGPSLLANFIRRVP